MVSITEWFHCIHMYYCTSESGIWLDIAHVRLYLHELKPSKNVAHKSLFSSHEYRNVFIAQFQSTCKSAFQLQH